MKFALLVANRGFFPSSVIESAKEEMREAVKKVGAELLELPAGKTRYGAVETTGEGRIYADFLREHTGEFDGLILSLPNFGDENGIKEAIRDLNVPILLQAYPDEIGKMDFANRRDAFCGKLGLCSVFKQMNVRFTSGMPFVMHPCSEAFHKELTDFVSICNVVKHMRGLRLGVMGARTTAFKSVRYDEIALEKHGVDVETLDFSQLLEAYDQVNREDPALKQWQEELHNTSDFHLAPQGSDLTLARLGVAMERMIAERQLDAVAMRCWNEMQTALRITPCAVMGIFNQRGIPVICETDVTNGVMMAALTYAGNGKTGCLDINNNYGEEEDKCILFHCGPLPMDLLDGKGEIQEHKMFVKTMGENCSWGLNVGKIRPGEITLAGGRTEDGEMRFYVERGIVTADPVEEAFFGTSGVLALPDLQQKLMHMSEEGFRHHAVITRGDHLRAVSEALEKYLGYRQIHL